MEWIPYIQYIDLSKNKMNESLLKDQTGKFIRMLLPEEPLPISFPIGSVGSLIYPENGGTGFVVETYPNNVNTDDPIAIVVSASHVVHNTGVKSIGEYPWLFTFDHILNPEYGLALKGYTRSFKVFKKEFKSITKNSEVYTAKPIEHAIN